MPVFDASQGTREAFLSGLAWRRQKEQDEQAAKDQERQFKIQEQQLKLQKLLFEQGRIEAANKQQSELAGLLSGQAQPFEYGAMNASEGVGPVRQMGNARFSQINPITGQTASFPIPNSEDIARVAEAERGADLARDMQFERFKAFLEQATRAPEQPFAGFGSGGVLNRQTGEITREPFPPASQNINIDLSEDRGQLQAIAMMIASAEQQTPGQGRSLFNSFSQDVRDGLLPLLVPMGFTDFGQQLSDSAITTISDSELALDSLQGLLTIVTEKPEFFGPVVGRVGPLIPGSASQALQAEIDKVKQSVGKALEGGVLRAEDERKYDRILARLSNRPNIAAAKIRGLMADFNFKLNSFRSQQQGSGRYVPPSGVSLTDELITAYLVLSGGDIDAAMAIASEDGFDTD